MGNQTSYNPRRMDGLQTVHIQPHHQSQESSVFFFQAVYANQRHQEWT